MFCFVLLPKNNKIDVKIVLKFKVKLEEKEKERDGIRVAAKARMTAGMPKQLVCVCVHVCMDDVCAHCACALTTLLDSNASCNSIFEFECNPKNLISCFHP